MQLIDTTHIEEFGVKFSNSPTIFRGKAAVIERSKNRDNEPKHRVFFLDGDPQLKGHELWIEPVGTFGTYCIVVRADT